MAWTLCKAWAAMAPSLDLSQSAKRYRDSSCYILDSEQSGYSLDRARWWICYCSWAGKGKTIKLLPLTLLAMCLPTNPWTRSIIQLWGKISQTTVIVENLRWNKEMLKWKKEANPTMLFLQNRSSLIISNRWDSKCKQPDRFPKVCPEAKNRLMRIW